MDAGRGCRVWHCAKRASSLHRPSAFTLIELLVVISIVALLIAILLPALQNGRAVARSVACLSNERQIGVLFYTYAEENKGWIPPTMNRYDVTPFPFRGWYNFMFAQMGIGATSDAPKVFYCPDFPGIVNKPRGCYAMNQYVGNEDAAWSRSVWDYSTNNWNSASKYYNLHQTKQPSNVYLVSDTYNNSSGSAIYQMETDSATGDTVSRWHLDRINVLFMDSSAKTVSRLADARGRWSPGYLPWMNRTTYSTTYPLPTD